MGRPDNKVVLSAMGIRAVDTATTKVPEGTCVAFYCAYRQGISDSLGNAIEAGTPKPVVAVGSGESVPDYWLMSSFIPDLNITGTDHGNSAGAAIGTAGPEYGDMHRAPGVR